jgi:hypothetical protein
MNEPAGGSTKLIRRCEGTLREFTPKRRRVYENTEDI